MDLLIDDARVPARSVRTFAVVSPISRDVIADVADGGAEDVAVAVDGAAAAFRTWRSTTPGERAGLVLRLAEEIERRAYDLARLDAIDSGAPVSTMLLDVRIASQSLRYFAGLAMETKGYVVPASTNLHFTELQPDSVVCKIIPFKHPFMFAASQVGTPLIAGKTVVLKPAEATPLSALMLADLIQRILPPGVVRIVVEDGREVPEETVRTGAVRRATPSRSPSR